MLVLGEVGAGGGGEIFPMYGSHRKETNRGIFRV